MDFTALHKKTPLPRIWFQNRALTSLRCGKAEPLKPLSRALMSPLLRSHVKASHRKTYILFDLRRSRRIGEPLLRRHVARRSSWRRRQVTLPVEVVRPDVSTSVNERRFRPELTPREWAFWTKFDSGLGETLSPLVADPLKTITIHIGRPSCSAVLNKPAVHILSRRVWLTREAGWSPHQAAAVTLRLALRRVMTLRPYFPPTMSVLRMPAGEVSPLSGSANR